MLTLETCEEFNQRLYFIYYTATTKEQSKDIILSFKESISFGKFDFILDLQIKLYRLT